jgi:hypothetical protein
MDVSLMQFLLSIVIYYCTWLISDSKTVQVDEKGEKVRSLVNSGMLILREIPENTPVEVRCIKFAVT